MDGTVQSLLAQMSLAADPAQVEVLRFQLREAIDQRLQELEQDDQTHCLRCSYILTLGAEDICFCCAGVCPCGNQWPPYNEFFRCEVQARLSWFALEAALFQLRPSERPFEPRLFPSDPLPAMPALKPGASRFNLLQQADLAQFAAQFTTLTQVGGGRWRGKCPLHKENTGSFYVFANPWRWQCFGGCAQGGDYLFLAKELKRAGKL